MNNLKVFKFRFDNNGLFCIAVVAGESLEEAELSLINDYKEYGISIIIEDYEEVEEKGVILTYHEAIPCN